MKKQVTFILASAILLLNACKKDDSNTTTNPTNPSNPTNPYYFKFGFNGTNYNFAGTIPQYHYLYENEIGGFQETFALSLPDIGLFISWPNGHTVTEADVTGLAGRTLSANDTNAHPELEFMSSTSSSDFWNSDDAAVPVCSVHVTSVTFLKKDTILGTPIRAYVLKGTCTGKLNNGTTDANLTNGDFNFIISSQDH